eukprot:g2338.t1
MGRAEIGRSLGLTTQAVSNIIADLLEEGWILEKGARTLGRGLPAVQYGLNPKGGYAFGVEIRPDAVFTALLDLFGAPVKTERTELRSTSPDVVAQTVLDLRHALLKAASVPQKRLLGTGVVMPGPFGKTGLSGRSTDLKGWENTDARALFEEALGGQVELSNDANAAALSENLTGVAQGASSYAYIYFGRGVGLGIVADGRLVSGAFGNAGEVGQIPVAGNDGLVPLESLLSRDSLQAAIGGEQALGLEELAGLFDEGDPRLTRWIETAVGALGQALPILENLLDPQTVILAGRPFLVELWRALTPLRSTVSFMNTGAHPDDEISDLLAKLSLGDGVDVSYACSTRGEGGQNDLGREATQALGVLRTAEMEQAALRLGMRLYWFSESPQDTVFDFGFSKSGQETLKKWGRARTLKRFVDILRSERPDIVCTTFLDVPGQHGHHRAMTEAAEEAIGLAADPAYEDSSLPAWTVSKFYLPAWSGAGQAYDDDLPPPPATIAVSGKGFDPATGQSFQRLGQWSRACHLTQAMGRWVSHGSEADWPLHLKLANIDGSEASLTSGLPETLADLGGSEALKSADREIAAAVEAFGDGTSVLKHAAAALKSLREGRKTADPRYLHKIARKESQLANLIRIAAMVDCRAWLDRDMLRPDDMAGLTVELHKGGADRAEADPVLPAGWEKTPDGLKLNGAAPSDPYPDRYLPDEPSAPYLSVDVTVDGVSSMSRIPFEIPPQVLPGVCADVSPSTAIVNLSRNRRCLHLSVSSVQPEGGAVSLQVSEGWGVSKTEDGFFVSLPRDVAEGLYKIGVQVDGKEAQSVQAVSYPHTVPRHLSAPAEVSVRVVEAGTATANIGYVGAGNDRVDHWLAALGFSVTQLTPEDLKNDAVLERLQTIVIGIFAMRFQEGLQEAMPALHRWVQRGGTLLTLYHRPWDNWDPDTVPPARLEIGQPSLRWRVTDENAAVTHLQADHPVLTAPNSIGPDDWDGWHKERGLYFAKSWDPAYSSLLEMADPGEAPQRGALLAGDFGKGRHVHCALILHHQMEKLVPGAFRLLSIVKHLGLEYSAGQLVFFRALTGLVVMLPWVISSAGEFRRVDRLPLHLMRVAASTIALTAGFFAIARLPLALITVVNFTRPILTMVMAVLVLREVIGPRRWIAAAIAFAGVVIAVSPGSAD